MAYEASPVYPDEPNFKHLFIVLDHATFKLDFCERMIVLPVR
jgi:hypothetical protein